MATTPTETFTQWLIDHGYEAYVHDAGEGDLEISDGTIDDRPGDLQSLFSTQYAAWLHHLMTTYGIGEDEDGDGIVNVYHDQNDPDGSPEFEGTTPEQLAGVFSDHDDFVWMSSVNPASSEHTVSHERHYWDAFTPAGTPAANSNAGDVPAGGGGPEAGTPSLAARVHFPDTNVAFDLDGGAGNAAKLIGAAFGKPFLTPEFMGVGIGLFDAGLSMQEVGGLALGTSLFQELAGSASNEDFVNFVHQNIAGTRPSVAMREYYIGLLEGSGGSLTQAELLALAAESSENAENIDLAGLQQSGFEFA